MTTLTTPLVRRTTGTIRVAPTGEIDLSTKGVFRDAIHTAIRSRPSPTAVEVDLRGVTFCDCGGVEVLLRERAVAHSRGIVFRATNAHGVVLRVLRLLGADDLLLRGPVPPA